MLRIVKQVRQVQTRFKALALLNLELAKIEGKKKATALGIAVGLALLAAVLVVYSLGFLFAAAAAGLDEALPLWLALLVVAIVLLALASIAGFVAVRFAKKASPPAPAQAIDEAKRTLETLRSHA